MSDTLQFPVARCAHFVQIPGACATDPMLASWVPGYESDQHNPRDTTRLSEHLFSER
jgi:hypothetical protein